LTAQLFAQGRQSPFKLLVVTSRLGEKPPGAVDPLLGEGSDEPLPVDAVEEVVAGDVVVELRAVRKLEGELSRGGRRRRPPPPSR
jgi:hypothetical protein